MNRSRDGSARTRTLAAIWRARLGRLLLVALVAASANARGYSLDQFQPTLPDDRFFAVQGTEIGGHLVLRAMLEVDYAYRPLVLTVGDVVNDQVVLHAAASLSLWDRVLLGADMPLTLLLTKNNSTCVMQGMPCALTGFAVGDLRVGLRARLGGEPGSLASLGLTAQLYAPTGSQDHLTTSGGVHGGPALVVSGRGARFAYATTGGVDLRKQSVRDAHAGMNGCPPVVQVTRQEIVIREQVQFQSDSAVILSASDDLLLQVARVLAEHPEIRSLEVQGHTDNQGNRAYNMSLSEQRAQAVVRWLVEKGKVDGARLTARGYGMEVPISENDTPEGRQEKPARAVRDRRGRGQFARLLRRSHALKPKRTRTRNSASSGN